MMDSVYCIIVTYNGAIWIEQCIDSIKEEKINLKIIVVDNNSQDDTCGIIKNRYSYIQLIELKQNIGFGGANNLGVEIAIKEKAKYVYLLNQDTISYPNNIFNLVQIGEENENIGVISPIHLNDNGDKLDFSFEESVRYGNNPKLISDLFLKKNQNYYQLPDVCAAAWLVKIEVIKKIGLFSRMFYHYGEDTNFTQRLNYHHFRLVIATNIFINHCREERKKVNYNKSHQKRKYDIILKSNILNINHSYLYCYTKCLLFSLDAIRNKKYISFLKIIFYPILYFNKYSYVRKSFRKIKGNIFSL